MKKVLLLVALLPLFYTAKGQDTITNPNLERWTNMGTYDEPNNWHTLNPLTSALGIVVAYKSTDAHAGTNAAKLVTKSILNNTRPSLITTGTVNVTQSTIDGGAPISARPVAFTGWYKYAPVNTDTATFGIILTKWNGTSRDVVGSGAYQVTAAAGTYTNFSVPVNYTLPDVPDTVQLLIVSSSNLAPQLNTTLYVDDMGYDFATGITTQKIEGAKLFPNPTNGVASLQFNLDGTQAIDVAIFNTVGQNVKSIYSGKSNGGLNQVQFSTADLPQGIYWVRLNAGGKTTTEKLVIN